MVYQPAHSCLHSSHPETYVETIATAKVQHELAHCVSLTSNEKFVFSKLVLEPCKR